MDANHLKRATETPPPPPTLLTTTMNDSMSETERGKVTTEHLLARLAGFLMLESLFE